MDNLKITERSLEWHSGVTRNRIVCLVITVIAAIILAVLCPLDTGSIAGVSHQYLYVGALGLVTIGALWQIKRMTIPTKHPDYLPLQDSHDDQRDIFTYLEEAKNSQTSEALAIKKEARLQARELFDNTGYEVVQTSPYSALKKRYEKERELSQNLLIADIKRRQAAGGDATLPKNAAFAPSRAKMRNNNKKLI